MTTIPKLKVLLFDVFGTCVAQRPPVADELWRAAREALDSELLSISDEVRDKASKMSYEQWDEFGAEWNRDVEKFVSASIAENQSVQWRAVEDYRSLASFYKLLAQHGLMNLRENASTSELHVRDGSLWDESRLHHLGRIWHRLPPWPDTCRGLDLLNKQFRTATLSNTYNDLMQDLVARNSMPFQHVYTADVFQSYKPSPNVYLGAAEKMSVKPAECALVAAHLGDLKAAKACGFYAIYVERPLEEKAPELREEGIPDLRIPEDADGFITLAERLRVQDS